MKKRIFLLLMMCCIGFAHGKKDEDDVTGRAKHKKPWKVTTCVSLPTEIADPISIRSSHFIPTKREQHTLDVPYQRSVSDEYSLRRLRQARFRDGPPKIGIADESYQSALVKMRFHRLREGAPNITGQFILRKPIDTGGKVTGNEPVLQTRKLALTPPINGEPRRIEKLHKPHK